MKKKFNFKILLIVIMILVMVVAFAACGKDDDGGVTDVLTKEIFFDNLWKGASAIGSTSVDSKKDLAISLGLELGLKWTGFDINLDIQIDAILDQTSFVTEKDDEGNDVQVKTGENSGVRISIAETKVVKGDLLVVYYFFADPTAAYIELLGQKYVFNFDLTENNQVTTTIEEAETIQELGTFVLSWLVEPRIGVTKQDANGKLITEKNDKGEDVYVKEDKSIIEFIGLFTKSFGPNWTLNTLINDVAKILGLDLDELLDNATIKAIFGTVSTVNGNLNVKDIIDQALGLLFSTNKPTQSGNYYEIKFSSTVVGIIGGLLNEFMGTSSSILNSSQAKIGYTLDNAGNISNLSLSFDTNKDKPATQAVTVSIKINKLRISNTTASTDTLLTGKTASQLSSFTSAFKDYTMQATLEIDLTNVGDIKLNIEDYLDGAKINGYLFIDIEISAALVAGSTGDGVDGVVVVKYGASKTTAATVIEASAVTTNGVTQFNIKVNNEALSGLDKAAADGVVGIALNALSELFEDDNDAVSQVFKDAYEYYVNNGVTQFSITAFDFASILYTQIFSYTDSRVVVEVLDAAIASLTISDDAKIGDTIYEIKLWNIICIIVNSTKTYNGTLGAGIEINVYDVLSRLLPTEKRGGVGENKNDLVLTSNAIVTYYTFDGYEYDDKGKIIKTKKTEKKMTVAQVIEYCINSLGDPTSIMETFAGTAYLVETTEAKYNAAVAANSYSVVRIGEEGSYVYIDVVETIINLFNADVKLIIAVDKATSALNIYLSYTDYNGKTLTAQLGIVGSQGRIDMTDKVVELDDNYEIYYLEIKVEEVTVGGDTDDDTDGDQD